MAGYYVPLPGAEVRNALVDFSPINNGLNAIRDQNNQNRNALMQQQQLDMRKDEIQYQRGRDAQQDNLAKVKRGGEMANAILNMPDTDPAKQVAWSRYLKTFGDGNHSPEELDFRTGPKIAAAAAGKFLDPRESQLMDLKIAGARGDIASGNIQREKAQFDLQQAKATAGSGKIMEGDKPLIRVNPQTNQVETLYSPQNAKGLGPYKDMKQLSDVSEGMRKEYASIAKPYFEVRDAYSRINQSAKDPSAAGDLALIFNFMKMLDPGSVVREGEFATAQNAAGIPDRIRNMWNKALNGERLNESQRADFVNQSGGLMRRQEAQYKKIQDQYSGIASRSGLDPQNVIIDFSAPTEEGATPSVTAVPAQGVAAPKSAAEYQALPSGTTYRDPDGNMRTKP